MVDLQIKDQYLEFLLIILKFLIIEQLHLYLNIFLESLVVKEHFIIIQLPIYFILLLLIFHFKRIFILIIQYQIH